MPGEAAFFRWMRGWMAANSGASELCAALWLENKCRLPEDRCREDQDANILRQIIMHVVCTAIASPGSWLHVLMADPASAAAGYLPRFVLSAFCPQNRTG